MEEEPPKEAIEGARVQAVKKRKQMDQQILARLRQVFQFFESLCLPKIGPQGVLGDEK